MSSSNTTIADDSIQALWEFVQAWNNTNQSTYSSEDTTAYNDTTAYYNNTNTNSTNTTTTTPTESDSAILRATFTTYGSVFLAVLIVFSFVRRQFPRAFNLRSWVEDRKTPLADTQYGFFSWAWKLASLPDEVMLDECGMDAISFLRILHMGIKFCCVGMVCAAFLMPLYWTAPKTDVTQDITDNVVKMTTGHVGPGSSRLIATAVAAYLVFGYAMYYIHHEMEHFLLTMRFRFLAKPKARNYAIYLRNIPPHYQTNQAIQLFFEKCLGVDQVLEAHVALKTSQLQTKVAARETTVFQLEHAVAVHELKGERPTHTVDGLVPVPVPGMPEGETVDSIEYYAQQLLEQNKDISQRIDALRKEAEKDLDVRAVTSGDWDQDSTDHPTDEDDDNNFLGFVKNSAVGVVSNVKDGAGNIAGNATDLVGSVARQSISLLGGDDDGEIYSAGFVVFKKLSTVQAALRMTHYEKPYTMECLEAPDPDDIFWKNVGRQHKDLQLGQLFSLAATTAACLLWTIPVAFVSSLSSVEALRQEIPFIDSMLTAAPFLVPLFEVLAPQFLVILNALLPVILTIFTQLEGPISGAIVEASLFMKLSAFMIVQTFFVSALSGSIMEELSNLVRDPLAVVDLLARSLPARATFFMQLSFVMSVTTFTIEGLRIAPLAIALVRRSVGPNLTEKERSTPYMGLAPLNEPSDFPHADFLSNMVLFFIIFLVYAVIAPLVSFILCLCFAIMGSLFRHQFVYIYNAKPDSGGFLYLNFIRILTKCLLIGEITVSGLLALKKAPATVMMLPLIIATILFNAYLAQKHYAIAELLPSRLCLKQDRKNADMDYSFVREAYLQPELQEKKVLPELPEEQLETLGLLGSDEEDGGGVTCRVTKLELFPSYSDERPFNTETEMSSQSLVEGTA